MTELLESVLALLLFFGMHGAILMWGTQSTLSIYNMRKKVTISRNISNTGDRLEKTLRRLCKSPRSRLSRWEAEHWAEKIISQREFTRKSYDEYRENFPHRKEQRLQIQSALLIDKDKREYEYAKCFSTHHFRAKEAAQGLAWIYVFHLRQLEGFVENSRVLRHLPYSVKKTICQKPF